MAEAGGSEEVFEVLSQACSDDYEVMKAAEHRLLSWEETPGFIRTLAEIGTSRQLPTAPRLLAMVWLKTLVDRHWRRDHHGPLPDHEREAIRVCLLSAQAQPHTEPIDAIATQEALVIGTIARAELPAGWPDLLPSIVDEVRSTVGVPQQRGLTTLYRITKALASRRLRSAREMFRQLSVDMFPFLADLFFERIDSAFTEIGQAESPAAAEAVAPQFELGRLILKLIRVLLGHGYSDGDQSDAVAIFLDAAIQRLTALVDLRISLVDTGATTTMGAAEKCLLTGQKLMLDLHALNTRATAPHLALTIPFALDQITRGTEAGRCERSAVLAMSLLINVICCADYRSPPSARLETVFSAVGAGGAAADVWRAIATGRSADIKLDDATVAAVYQVADVLQPDVLTQLCETLVTQYFLLTDTDLHDWSTTPEEYAFDESGEAWKFALRPAAEFLFGSLMQQFQTMLGPVVATHVESTLSEEPTSESDVLRREAAYAALSACAGEPKSVATALHDYINFDDLFTGVLLSDLGVAAREYTPVRRRALIAVGEWVSVRFDIKEELGLREQLYGALVVLLSPDEDIVVRIAATSTLQHVIDDFGFRANVLVPFLADLMPLMFDLLASVAECDSKMKVLGIITLIVDRVGSTHMEVYTNTLFGHLPGLWADAVADPSFGLLRTVIVRSLSKVIETLGAADIGFTEFLCDVVRFSLDDDDSNPDKVYLLDDGLLLCHTILQNSSQLTASMVEVVASVLRLLDRGGEFVKLCLLIAESYVMLGGAEMLEAQGADLAAALQPMVGEVPPDGAAVLCRLIDLILCLFPEEGGAMLAEVLHTIVMNLLLNGDAQSSESANLYAPYMMVITRIVLVNPTLFFETIGRIAAEAGDDPMAPLIDLWLERFDAVVAQRWRKLSVLAIAAALSYPQLDEYLHPRYGLVINVLVSGVHQFHILGEDELPVDFLVRFSEEDEADDDGTAVATEPGRRREVSRRDAVYTHNMREFLAANLAALAERLGRDAFGSLQESIDPALLMQLTRFVNMP